jgi:hypothetical protein
MWLNSIDDFHLKEVGVEVLAGFVYVQSGSGGGPA